MDIFRQYRDVLKDKTVILAPTYEELTEMDDILSSQKTVIWYDAEDETDIRRVMKLLEKYR